jgi:predicted N-acetyltransferase YhbS
MTGTAERSGASLRLRTASSHDAEAIAALINTAFSVEAFFIDGDRIDVRGVQELLAKGSFLLAEKESGRPVGCVYLEVNGPRGYFGLLSVDPDVQGAGVGRQLVAASEDHCRAAGCSVLGIRVVNLREVLPPFYRRLGYEVTGTEPFPEGKETKLPCHFILMSKAL